MAEMCHKAFSTRPNTSHPFLLAHSRSASHCKSQMVLLHRIECQPQNSKQLATIKKPSIFSPPPKRSFSHTLGASAANYSHFVLRAFNCAAQQKSSNNVSLTSESKNVLCVSTRSVTHVGLVTSAKFVTCFETGMALCENRQSDDDDALLLN